MKNIERLAWAFETVRKYIQRNFMTKHNFKSSLWR